jgi:hypothetical protein
LPEPSSGRRFELLAFVSSLCSAGFAAEMEILSLAGFLKGVTAKIQGVFIWRVYEILNNAPTIFIIARFDLLAPLGNLTEKTSQAS